jgi:hypothetical protein
VAGWNFLWTRNDLPTLWKGLRDYELIGGFYPFAVLLVGLLSAAVPFGMKFFIGLAIQRYRENEMEHTPEAVAQRMVEPFAVQVIATRMMQEQMLALTGQFNNPLILPNPQARASLADLGIDADAEMARILAERAAQRQESAHGHPFEPLGLSASEQAEVLRAVEKAAQPTVEASDTFFSPNTHDIERASDFADQPSQAVTEASEPMGDDRSPDEVRAAWGAAEEEDAEEDEPMLLEDAQEELAQYGWERLSWAAMEVLPDSDEKTAELERRRLGRENLKQVGLTFLRDIGLLPAPEDVPAEASQEAAGIAEGEGVVAGMAGAAEPVLGASTPAVNTWECAGCEAEGSNGSKGVAKKWSATRKLGDRLYCKPCRDGYTG